MKTRALAFLGLMGAMGLDAAPLKDKNIGVDKIGHFANFTGAHSPIYFGKSQRAKKENKLNRSHKIRQRHKRAKR